MKLQFIPPSDQTNLIQATADFVHWTTVDTVVGDGGIVSQIYGVTNGLRFFRLQRQ